MLASNILATSVRAQAYGYTKKEALVIAFKAHTGHMEVSLRLTIWSLLTGLPVSSLRA